MAREKSTKLLNIQYFLSFIIHPFKVMKSIQSPIVFLNWLEDGLHCSSYQPWKPKHSWCQSKFDKWVRGALLQPVCHHDCDKHGTDLNTGNLPSLCFSPCDSKCMLACAACLHFLNLPMKYRSWEKFKKLFYILKHCIGHLVTACHIC